MQGVASTILIHLPAAAGRLRSPDRSRLFIHLHVRVSRSSAVRVRQFPLTSVASLVYESRGMHGDRSQE